MQTFLPFASFEDSARVLDNARLGKQRVEAAQILDTLEGRSQGWKNHPAVRMWRGYESSLRVYMHVVCVEWRARGFECGYATQDNSNAPRPPWIGYEPFHASHRSNLKRKNATFYSWVPEPNNFPYFWPVGKNERAEDFIISKNKIMVVPPFGIPIVMTEAVTIGGRGRGGGEGRGRLESSGSPEGVGYLPACRQGPASQQ